MPLETGDYISDLVPANPAFNDKIGFADDHMRLIKKTVQQSLPNVAGVVSASDVELSYSSGVTSSIQDQLNSITDQRMPVGSSTNWFNPTAPLGWTIDTTHNNKALRIVDSNGGTFGGSNSFSTAFNAPFSTSSDGSHSHSVTVNNHALTTGQLPSHAHSITTYVTFFVGSGGGQSFNAISPVGTSTGSVGSNQGHNHSASSGSAGTHSHTTDLDVQYVDSIICTKDAYA